MERTCPSRLILAALLVLLGASCADPRATADPVEDRAHELERHLIAPCCFRETLDVHESPIATSLRQEIRRRLGAGESAEAIEASLIARHGAKMRATLPGSLGSALALVLFVGGPGLFLLWWRWRRGGAGVRPAPRGFVPADSLDELSAQERHRLEERLDDDLE